jgi:hypothetical protein
MLKYLKVLKREIENTFFVGKKMASNVVYLNTNTVTQMKEFMTVDSKRIKYMDFGVPFIRIVQAFDFTRTVFSFVSSASI